MIEDIIFETKGSNQCEIKLQHSTGETTTLLFNSTFPLQAQEYYLKAIQLLQQEKPYLSPKDDLFGIFTLWFVQNSLEMPLGVGTSKNEERIRIGKRIKEIREEKGQYDYTDVVNACGLSYARLYSEIEQRYENEQYYKVDGTPLTKEDEIEWLDMQFEQEVAWQKSCARITAQGQVIQGNIPEMPTEEMEELEDSFYQAKDAYMKLYRESRQVGKPLVLQNYIFGNGRMYEVLNRLGNLQERVE